MSFGPRVGALLATLAGVLFWLGFAGVGAWPLALVAFVPFFVAVERDARTSGRRVWLLGLLFGTVIWTAGGSWVLGTLRTFSGLPLLACLALATLFWIYHGGQFALFGWLWWRARRRGASAALAAAAAFATAEFVYPQVFPSHYAASFHDVPIALQIVELGGPLLPSALCVAVSAALYELFATPRSPVARRAAATLATCVVATLGYGALRISQVDASVRDAPRLSVGIVQPNMGSFAKWSKLREGHQRLVDDTRQLVASVAPELILWPETSYAAGLPADIGRVPEAVTGGAKTPLLFGSMAYTGEGRERRAFNRVHLIDERGQLTGSYDKVNLLVFGEYLPFVSRLPWLRALSPRSGRFEAGGHVHPLTFREWRISALVCYEDVLPGFVRRVVREGSPHLLVNLTNDAWFGDSSEPRIHLALATLRAIEQRRYLVRATNTGISAVIDPVGRVVVQSGVLTRESLHAEVAMLQGSTPYLILGNWPGWLALATILWLAFARRAAQ